MLLLGLLLAAPVRAAQVVAVRVGNHPTFTRVVFELDAPAGYRMERSSEGGVSEVLVTLEAGSTLRRVQREATAQLDHDGEELGR